MTPTPLSSCQRVAAMREAGATSRVHAMAHHGVYKVDGHSWNATMLILMFHPEPSLRLIRAVMTHDVAERWLGDLPYPAKKEFPALGAAYTQAETHVEAILGVSETLNLQELDWLRSVDMLEFALWCRDQLNLGNRNVAGPLETAVVILKKFVADGTMPRPLHEIFFGMVEPAADFMTEPARTSDFIKKTYEEALIDVKRSE